MARHCLPGPAALPPFRLGKTFALLRRHLPAITGASAWTIHFVDAETTLHEGEIRVLERLLGAPPTDRAANHDPAAGPGAPPARGRGPSGFPGPGPVPGACRGRVDGEVRVLVIPRAGTISPWSSKATDIVRNCGFPHVRRVERGTLWLISGSVHLAGPELELLHDRMTERIVVNPEPTAGSQPGFAARGIAAPADLFLDAAPRPLVSIGLRPDAERALRDADRRLGLALNEEEIRWLGERFGSGPLARDPTDAELMMFAQANSEHCRHKIFNAAWTVDGRESERSLFQMIRHTHAANPGRVLSAYRDNAAVVEGGVTRWFTPDPETGAYRFVPEPSGLLMKVETHNHPTAVSPFAGAATGSGGEIRDEAATGRGAQSRAGLAGFSVSSLRIPGFVQPWEGDGAGTPDHIATALDIMLEAPIGAARFNNEFGRPALAGYFRTFEQARDGEDHAWHGYHKPIMVAGGMGRIRIRHVAKASLRPGDRVGVLGGPAMLIGLGGGAASSGRTPGSGANDDPHRRELDFASVQRDNAEMQRRAQEVIDTCTGLGVRNPIRSIHDVGAGGLANAVPELVHAAGLGVRVDLRAIPSADPGMSPMEIWCNEAQERYVLAFHPADRARIESICRRERCPFSVIGTVTRALRIELVDERGGKRAVDVPIDLVLGDAPRLVREARHIPDAPRRRVAPPTGADLMSALAPVLRLPCVADKSFLVTIGDRTVSGFVTRDQMVGPWQVPVADCAVTLADHVGFAGEAMAIGERAPLAVLDPAASVRMAIGEALTNLAAAGIGNLRETVLSANWMADADRDDTALHDAVRAAGLEFCPRLGIPIPVGKDSLSMRTAWREGGRERTVSAPLSLVATAFAPVADVRRAVTPVLARDIDNRLLLVDLGLGRNRMGASALARTSSDRGGEPPDAEADVLRGFLDALQSLIAGRVVIAYHDRSDGGLAAALCEMAFAGRAGLRIDLTALGADPVPALFCEELGAVLQVRAGDAPSVLERLRTAPGLRAHVHSIGEAGAGSRIRFEHRGNAVLDTARTELHRIWSETSYRMQALRDDPECAREAFDTLFDETDPGLGSSLAFSFGPAAAPVPHPGPARANDPAVRPESRSPPPPRPRVAILREQGVNGHRELAAAFERAGFEAVDIHMTDLLEGRRSLETFAGLAAGGGFSYGDVLGAGRGWAAAILHRNELRDAFGAFFARPDTFTLGICNGCQMLARLDSLIPGAQGWPRFVSNRSGQFEARLVMCEILDSPSIFFRGMAGSKLPVAVAHGEGRADPGSDPPPACLRFVDNRHRLAERYPANPNGSPGGLTGFTSRDGRATILMPHPERIFRTVQCSWHPPDWGEDSPWMEMFRNALRWCETAGSDL